MPRRPIVASSENGKMEPVITVDDEELTWRDFGRLISGYGGRGMRIEVVTEDETHRRPKMEVREQKSQRHDPGCCW